MENVMELFSLKGRVAIVTGGGQGLGKSMAIGLAQAGADIVIAARRTETAMETKKIIEDIGVKCTVIKGDMRVEDDVKKMVSQVVEEYGKIDILFNNAGTWRGSDAEKMELEDWKEVIDVNLTGPFIVSREVGNVMLRQGKGSIVNVASMSGMIVNTPQNQCAYNASKGGLIMLTKSMAAEWADRGVRVNALCPGYMRTEMSEDRYQRKDPAIERWFSMTPMGRSGVPDELMGIAVYLASDASSFVTGASYLVDGGYTAW
ncbi:glucose 1-dehydrogenase [Clostridium sp. AM58-1XD]|uniref:SDR family NAD(P)-dependent oxidoreductase n=1 Tax=Clostridium sp. AM58-1XD TaxID=2292307 RepID=UPI000E50864C|nr:glucose 1-dehydrogenase [Clostridium sp. AM58-1XD]RGY98214.1 SDR family NAD(P)-dependent oxidoreductase [Clostridium sp. AM58-1XD]